jgi:hypothetical protein
MATGAGARQILFTGTAIKTAISDQGFVCNNWFHYAIDLNDDSFFVAKIIIKH